MSDHYFTIGRFSQIDPPLFFSIRLLGLSNFPPFYVPTNMPLKVKGTIL